MASKFKKVTTLRGFMDGLRQSVGSQSPKTELGIEETLKSEHFQVAKTFQHGFPFQPTAMAFDPVQHLLAIGTRTGSLRIFGRPGVECHVTHEGEPAIIQILILVNERALITACSDDQLHMWNLRQKKPVIVHSLRFQRERITYCHLPFQSKWLYIGTDKGNVHVLNIETFILSGYVINWNKAIELSRKTHPGLVVHLSDNPMDSNKLLIGFESGAIVLWDLKSKTAENRFNYSQALRSVCWNHEGKQFVGSHVDGSLTTWNPKQPQKPVSVQLPHAKTGKDGNLEPCNPIMKVDWKSVRNSEPFIIFSGGMPYDRQSRTPCLTVVHGKSTTVLEMEHNIVDFITLCGTPWDNDFQDPYAIVVLLENDLVVVDLTTPGYPCFENPYPMDIHESPVTCCQYYADCPTDLIPAFYSVGSRQAKSGFSEKEWPIKGGVAGRTTCSYPEIIITGHVDGTLKIWDASSVTLQVLYKVKTAKIFEKLKNRGGDLTCDYDDDPFAIQHISLDTESRVICVAGFTHVILLKFSKAEAVVDIPFLEVSIIYEIYDELDSPELEYPPNPIPKPTLGSMSEQSGSVGSYSSNASEMQGNKASENITCLKVKASSRKWLPGYQPDLVCLLTWNEGEPPPLITCVQFNSKYGILAFGNECGLAVVDFVQKTALLNMGTPDLYGSMNPNRRAPRSPKNKQQTCKSTEGSSYNNEECKSPTTDQSPIATGNQPLSPTRMRVSQGPVLESITEHHQITETIPAIQENEENGDKGEEQTPESKPNLQVPLVEVTEPSFEEAEEAEEEMTTYLQRLSSGSSSQDGDGSADVNIIVDSPDGEVLVEESVDDTNEEEDRRDSLVIRRTSSDSNSPSKTFGEYDWSKKKNRKAQSEKIRRPSRKSEPEGEGVRHKSSDDLVSKDQMEVEHNNNLEKSASEEILRDKTDQEETVHSRSKSGGMLRKMSKKIKKTFGHKKEEEIVPSTPPPTEPVSPLQQYPTPEQSDPDTSEETPQSEEKVKAEESKPTEEGKAEQHEGFMRKMSRKVRQSLHIHNDEDRPDGGRRNKFLELKFEMLDLTSDDPNDEPVTRRVNYATHALFDKNDGSFSRSRSSSMSSLENISKEAIQCLVFADAYTRKQDSYTCPCLWVGTSFGSVIVIVLNLPPDGDQRRTQPVIVSPSGTIFHLSGAILSMSFLDCNGVLIPAVSDQWKDEGREEKKPQSSKTDRVVLHKWPKCYDHIFHSQSGQTSVSSMRARMSPTQSTELSDRQFAIICSEKQARVMSLPSQNCAYKVKITETSFVAKADIVTFKEGVCLACYLANGHIMTFSLPGLKLLLDLLFLPLTDVRIAKTFSFSNNGHALYFCTPTEVQKITFSAEMSDNLSEMMGELFVPIDMPEAPKQSFFKNLFGGTSAQLDREQLFGEESGKASKGVAKYTPGSGMSRAQERANVATSEIAKAKMAAIERGEKLGELDEKTERMRDSAEAYSKSARDLMLKYKDKKWYQF